MDTVVIACRTLENELNRAMSECGCGYNIIWVESGLHNVPKKLHSALQEALDTADGHARALLAIGYCGNSLAGLCSKNAAMIIPRVDDCISLLLGSYKNRLALMQTENSYFMTEGWLRGERTIWKEYEYAINKYGEEIGKSVFEMILGNYKSLVMLDTGCYDISAIEDEAKKIAVELGLEYKVVPATIGYMKRLLTGPWEDGAFLTIPPGSVIREADLTLNG